MAIATAQAPSSYLSRSPNPSGLADVLNIILDKGLVIASGQGDDRLPVDE